MKKFIASLSKKIKKIKPSSFLQNKYVLYILAVIAIVNILMFANQKDYNSVFVFVIIGFLVSFFSKNMIVVLLSAILLTHALKYVLSTRESMKNKKKTKEGFEHEGEEKPEEEDEDEDILDTVDLDVEPTEDEADDDKLAKKQETYEKLKDDFTEFQSIQEDILKNMKEIDPLLTKAESFIEKFEQYKST
tara:strand:- start:28356 stop:28925 length:570 start_codon:yes stop_codon:yes gene_type:complete